MAIESEKHIFSKSFMNNHPESLVQYQFFPFWVPILQVLSQYYSEYNYTILCYAILCYTRPTIVLAMWRDRRFGYQQSMTFGRAAEAWSIWSTLSSALFKTGQSLARTVLLFIVKNHHQTWWFKRETWWFSCCLLECFLYKHAQINSYLNRNANHPIQNAQTAQDEQTPRLSGWSSVGCLVIYLLIPPYTSSRGWNHIIQYCSGM